MSSETPTRLTDDHVQALASLDPETIRAIGEAVDDAGGSGGMSRRQMLGVLAGLGGAGLATGYASREVTAQPTGDEGQMGQQGDRLEAWVSEMDVDEINSEVQANTEAELNQAISDGETAIRVTGPIPYSSKLNTVTTRGTSIYGYGFARDTNSAGDYLTGSVSGEVLEIAARDCEIRGLGISNTATDGVGILNNEAHTRFVGLSLHAGHKGIGDESGAGGLQFFENVVWSDNPGAAGGVGIDADTSTDCYFGGNKIVNFDTGVLARASSHLVWGEHIFGASSGSFGGRYGPGSHVVGSRFDIGDGAGNSGDAALEIGLNGGVILADLWTVGDADGIRITGSGPADDTPIRLCEFDGDSSATDDEAVALGSGVTGPVNAPSEDQRQVGGWADASMLGPTWQDVTSSRSFDSQETNGTGMEIEIQVVAIGGAGVSRIGVRLDVDGTQRDAIDLRAVEEFDELSVSASVPPGSTYQARAIGDTGNFSLSEWHELR